MILSTHPEIQVSDPNFFHPSVPRTSPGARSRFKYVLYDPAPIGNEPLRSILEHAREAARHGWHVFPLAAGSKEPLAGSHGWKDATTDEVQIREWFEAYPERNYGIATGPSRLLVVDLDQKHGKDGADELGHLEIAHEIIPKTASVKTPNGQHLYFQAPENSKGLSGTNKFAPGVDIQCEGRYVVGPGSVVDGTPYSWQSEAREPAEVPSWIIGLARGPAAEVASASAGKPTRLHIVSEALAHVGDRESYDRFRDVAFALRSAWRDGLILRDNREPAAEDEVLDVFDRWASGRLGHCKQPVNYEGREGCRAKWDEEGRSGGPKVALGSIFTWAWAGGWKGHDRDPRDVFAEITGHGESDALQIVPFSALYDSEPKPVAELIPGLIERGIPTFLCGPGGTNKSRLSIQLGLCIQSGKPVFGRQPEQATFFYFSAEDGIDEVIRRVHLLSKRLDIPKEQAGDARYLDCTGCAGPLFVVDEGGDCKTTSFYKETVAALRAIPGHKFVVFDSCYDFVTFKGHAKINEDAVNAFVKKSLLGFCREVDATLFVIWHPSQAGTERGNMSGWSVAWHNAPRARLSMREDKDSGTYVLKVEKRNHGPEGENIALYWSDGALLPRDGLQETEQWAKLFDACVTVAEKCARDSQPITQQKKLIKWQLDAIAEIAGYRPTDKEVKNELGKAVNRRRLIYARPTRHKAAGYYPAEGGDDLARGAKKQSKADRSKEAAKPSPP